MQTERRKPKTKTRPSGTSRTGRDPVTRYALDVVSGSIVAGPLVRRACKRHLDDLETGPERGLAWDVGAGLHVIGFFKDVLRLPDGEKADEQGRPSAP